jgi:hypothetical protein
MTPERVLMTLYGDRLEELRGFKTSSRRTVTNRRK